MNQKDFILINLNQNISKARHAANKKEKNNWIIFALICTIYISLISWLVVINISANHLISAREEKIDYINNETQKLDDVAKMKLSENEINGAYKLGEKWIPWSMKFMQLSEITPHNMSITKLDYSREELKISAISRIEAKDQKDMAICNEFIETLKNHEDFFKEFEKIEFSKSKRVENHNTPYLEFEIIASIKSKSKLKNRIDDIVIKKEDEKSRINVKRKKDKKKKVNQKKEIIKKEPVTDNVLAKSKIINNSKNEHEDKNKIKDSPLKDDITNQVNNSSTEESSFLDWPVLNYFFSTVDSNEKDNFIKRSNDKKELVNNNDKLEEESNEMKNIETPSYSNEIIELAKSINQSNSDSKSIGKLQKLLNIYNESDKMYGELDAKTILIISDILNKKPRTAWEKKFEEKNKALIGEYKKNDIQYSKLAIQIANKILEQNPDNPDPILIKEFQEATKIAFEGDPGYGKFNPRTISVWGKVLGVK